MRRECLERFSRHRYLAILACIRHVRRVRAVMHAGIANSAFEVGGGETFPAFPAHGQPAILRIC